MLPDRIELSTSPLPMECSTTELRQHARYGGIGPNGRPLGGRFLPQGPLWRKHAGRPERAQNRQKPALRIATSGNSASLGLTPVPDLVLSGQIVASTAWHAGGRIMSSMCLSGCTGLIAVWMIETHHLSAMASPAWPFQSRRVRRTDDEGRSRQGCGKVRRGCEGFTTGPAEAGVARKSQAAEVAGPRAQRCPLHLPKPPTHP